MQDRRLIITVRGEEYKRLAEQAQQDVRSPEQQAAYIVRRHIAETPSGGTDDRQPAEAAS